MSEDSQEKGFKRMSSLITVLAVVIPQTVVVTLWVGNINSTATQNKDDIKLLEQENREFQKEKMKILAVSKDIEYVKQDIKEMKKDVSDIAEFMRELGN